MKTMNKNLSLTGNIEQFWTNQFNSNYQTMVSFSVCTIHFSFELNKMCISIRSLQYVTFLVVLNNLLSPVSICPGEHQFSPDDHSPCFQSRSKVNYTHCFRLSWRKITSNIPWPLSSFDHYLDLHSLLKQTASSVRFSRSLAKPLIRFLIPLKFIQANLMYSQPESCFDFFLAFFVLSYRIVSLSSEVSSASLWLKSGVAPDAGSWNGYWFSVERRLKGEKNVKKHDKKLSPP